VNTQDMCQRGVLNAPFVWLFVTGAIVATGHEHSYSRSFLMSNITAQTVVSNNKSLPMVLDKGQTFVFVVRFLACNSFPIRIRPTFIRTLT